MEAMASEPSEKHLFSYIVASKDMFIEEVHERHICVYDDLETGFQIKAKIPGSIPAKCVDLCQILLEYTLTCQSSGDSPMACSRMEEFSRRLGMAIAHHLEDRPHAQISQSLGACVMECILSSLQAHYTVQHVGAEWTYLFSQCPLCETAERMGIHAIDLAHRGLKTLCQTLIHTLDPNLIVSIPTSSEMEHVFSVVSQSEI